MKPQRYRIRVRAVLDGSWTSAFQGMSLSMEADGMTGLCGYVTDQPALHGILNTLRDLNLEIISVLLLDADGATPVECRSCVKKETQNTSFDCCRTRRFIRSHWFMNKKRILVAYASKYGSTREIAEKAAEVLRASGLSVDVTPAARSADAAAYDAVLFGSAVYFGAWRRKAVVFLREWERLPAAPPLWLFFSGPTGNADPEAQAIGGKGIPERRKQLIEHIKPRGIAFFRGKLDEARLNGLERWAIRKANAQLGDFRDWGAITSWAETTATEIRRQS